jgi:SAM-dependent methyltransferase
VKGSDLEEIIELYQCTSNQISINQSVDFILAFYVIHELSDQEKGISQLCELLRPGGTLFLAEPGLFHVTKKEFEKTVGMIIDQGLCPIDKPRILLSKAAVFQK